MRSSHRRGGRPCCCGRGRAGRSARVAGGLGPLGPRVAVAVQADAFDAEAAAAFAEFVGAVAGKPAAEMREERSFLGQGVEDVGDGLPESDLRRGLILAPFRLHADVGDGPAGPVHVFGVEVGQVALRRAEVPRELVECLPLGVALAFNDAAVLFPRDGAPVFVPDDWPLPFGDQRPRQPVHVHTEIVEAAHMLVGGHAALAHNGQQFLALGLHQRARPQGREGSFFLGALPAFLVRAEFGFRQGNDGHPARCVCRWLRPPRTSRPGRFAGSASAGSRLRSSREGCGRPRSGRPFGGWCAYS